MRRGRLLAACAPLIVMVLACGTSGEEASVEGPPPVVSPTEPAEAVVDNVVRRDLFGYSMLDGQIDSCSEIRVTLTPPDPLPADWPPPPREVEAREDFTRISRPCREQFTDRTVLGTCTTTVNNEPNENGIRSTSVATTLWYWGLVLTDDRVMNACIRNGGQWVGIDRNSLEAQQARAEYELRESQRELDRLNSRRGR